MATLAPRQDADASASSRPTRNLFQRSVSARSNDSETSGHEGQSASRGARLFRTLTSKSAKSMARTPSVPPSLILDLEAGTAAASLSPTSSAFPRSMESRTEAPTAAAAVMAQANARQSAQPRDPQQRRKTAEAMANARLNVIQARDLVRMCGRQIRERGLDSVGLFRPFRIAESHQRVRYMVQLYLLTIDIAAYGTLFSVVPESVLDRMGGPSSNSDANPERKRKHARDELEKEMRYASPHEVVSVLKWGLRHMRLHPSDFHSKDADDWYRTFVAAERAAAYHPRAIADLLHPRLPQETAELLSELLDLIAAVAAHASTNHMSASTLCSALGFWMFGRIGVAHPPPTVGELLMATEKAGLMVEHLLLTHIRSQAAVTVAMPLRLSELVADYPDLQPGRHAPSLPSAFASRPIPTLCVNIKSDNLVVSQIKPRTPKATLAAALDAATSGLLQNSSTEEWDAIAACHYDSESGDLLSEEHARILQLVEEEIQLRTTSMLPQQTRPLLNTFLSSEKPPQLPELDIMPIPQPTKSSAEADESLEVIADAHATQESAALQTSASWQSFSEEGFGGGGRLLSTAASGLSLPAANVSAMPIPIPKAEVHSRRRTPSRGSPPPPSRMYTPAPPMPSGKTVSTSVTGVRMLTVPTGMSIMWQDQLLDLSPCCSLPCFVLVQLNTAVTHTSKDTWLMIVEKIIPPRPPTPPYSPTTRKPSKTSQWDADSTIAADNADKKSLLAPSIRSVKSTLRRVSTVIGRARRKRSQASQDTDPF